MVLRVSLPKIRSLARKKAAWLKMKVLKENYWLIEDLKELVFKANSHLIRILGCKLKKVTR